MMVQCSYSRSRASAQKAALLTLIALLPIGCLSEMDTRPARRAVTASPLTIRLESAPRLKNRHAYEVTQRPWGSPNVEVGEEVWRAAQPAAIYLGEEEPAAPFALGLGEGEFAAAFNEPAPYTQGTPMRLTADIGWYGPADRMPAKLQVGVIGALVSMTDPELKPIPILDTRASLTKHAQGPTRFVGFKADSAPLPTRLDLYMLELRWTILPQECGGPCPGLAQGVTRHRVPLTWREPRPELPRFREPFIWAAAWGAGVWPDGPPAAAATADSEIALSRKMLEGFSGLDRLGKSYGSFPRPRYDGKNSGLEMFLDFPRSACGEFKYGLMALIETHGIDAKWGALHFDKHGKDILSFYKTRPIAALGREQKHWYYANHAFTMVRGHVLDPTYDVYRPSLAEYDDFMFEKYCYGEETPCKVNSWCDTPPTDEAARCIDNPPGFDRDGSFRFYTGDGYY